VNERDYWRVALLLLFANAALPHRRLFPDWRFDLFVTAAGYAYLAVTRLAKPAVVRRRRQRRG